jgi:hypothetical protein
MSPVNAMYLLSRAAVPWYDDVPACMQLEVWYTCD